MKLDDFFIEYPIVAVAFSGGVDSSYLLYSAIESGADVQAYYVKSAFQPQFELDDALEIAADLKANLKILEVDVLADKNVKSNPSDRCYHCKKLIMAKITEMALADGYSMTIDGTNATDNAEDRPGLRALLERNVRSPLREYGLGKDEIRQLSKAAGLRTWDKPAFACLATRIPSGESITTEMLNKVERAESLLISLGISGSRVRMTGSTARIELPPSQIDVLLKNRAEIVQALKNDFRSVVLDLEVRIE